MPLPITVIAGLLGLPDGDIGGFKQMSDDLTASYNEPDPRASAEPRARFDRYFTELIERRRRQPADDLVSMFATGDVDGRKLTDTEICWLLLLLLLGGNETTTALLTNVLWRLLEVPERWEAVRDRPGAIDARDRGEPAPRSPRAGHVSHDHHRDRAPRRASSRPGARSCSVTGRPTTTRRCSRIRTTFRLERDRGRAPAAPRLRLRRPLLPRCGAGPPRGQGGAAGTRRTGSRHCTPVGPPGTDPPRITPFLLWGRSSLPAVWG